MYQISNFTFENIKITFRKRFRKLIFGKYIQFLSLTFIYHIHTLWLENVYKFKCHFFFLSI